MSQVPLRLGPLGAPGYRVPRSGVRWLRDERHACRPGEIVACCNLRIVPADPKTGSWPMGEEVRDFQVALATPVGGRLQRAGNLSRGGFLDRLADHIAWTPEQVIGHVQCRPGERPRGPDPHGETVGLMFAAGRRVTEVAEDRSGFLTGWHDRLRAWWGEGDTVGTLLGYGVCEQLGVFRGESIAFAEWYRASAGPAQVVYVPDHVLVPSVAVLAGQCGRSAVEAEAIRADAARSIALGPVAPSPSDWIFAGALVGALLRSPLTESCDVLMRDGLRRTAGPDAVVLSLNAESTAILRHRRLGYALQCHNYRMAADAGPAVRSWLERDFEVVPRTLGDIADDYRRLVDPAGPRARTAFLVMNAMSTSGFETLHTYAAFDAPLGNALNTIRAKELNLMLHDLAREGGVSIVDNDAIAADMGAAHLPDGVHNSGALQAELRSEILRILRARGVPGFA